MFDSIATLVVAQNMRELYRLVLVDGSFFFLPETPLAPYFSECITSEDLDDMNIEIMRNTLYKAYLEDFYRFCQADLLVFEADRRAAIITINSIGTELTREGRRKLYSNFGLLYPYGPEELAICEDTDQVINYIPSYVLS
ncbi:V-type proton ATPase subunit d1 [Salvia divinorum]|uniref:V-type proton ATPase subunit d1 n=1 Tax=Salvia divinorum TaxID=28513 RepID=A0ABD1FX69_SALDI